MTYTSSPFSPPSLSHIPYKCVIYSPDTPVTYTSSPFSPPSLSHIPYKCVIYSPDTPVTYTSSPFSPSSLSHIPYRCVIYSPDTPVTYHFISILTFIPLPYSLQMCHSSPAALVTPLVTTSISTLTSTHFLTSPYRCAVYSPTVPCHHPDHHPYLTFQVGV